VNGKAMLIATLLFAFLLSLAALRFFAHVGRDGMVHAEIPGERPRAMAPARTRDARPAHVKPKRLG
jgi:hypothetical protein